MISDELKQLILPHLRDHLMEQDWKYIEDMFTEVYFTKFAGVPRVTLKPHPELGEIAMQFDYLTGTFLEITQWDYIKEIGVLL